MTTYEQSGLYDDGREKLSRLSACEVVKVNHSEAVLRQRALAATKLLKVPLQELIQVENLIRVSSDQDEVLIDSVAQGDRFWRYEVAWSDGGTNYAYVPEKIYEQGDFSWAVY